jgi:phage terminase large subunit
VAQVVLPNGWEPRPYQKPLWNYLERGGKRALGIWHRRAGKDDVLLHRTAVAAFERPATYWTALPEYAQARKALWAAVNPHTGKRRIDEAFPRELRETTNEQEMFIRFRNGSTWQLIGSDRYNSLVGAGVAGVTFSEWALCNPSAWGYIRPMLEENDGWAAFITTPRGRNHAQTMLAMAQKNPRWFAEVLSISDTGALTEEQIEESLAEYISLYGEDLGRAQFDQEYRCSFNAAILGAFYAREMLAVRNSGRIKDFEPEPGQPVHTAWDIGVRDDTSIWWFQVVGNEVRILDCHTASGGDVEAFAEVCHGKGWTRGIDFVPHDAKVKEWGTGRTRIETMKRHGLNPRLVPNASKMDGIHAVRTTLARALFHTRTEEVGIAALEQYRREWDDERKAFRASEVRDWTTHLADAARYMAMAWREVPAEKPKVGHRLVDPAGRSRMMAPPPKVMQDMTFDEFHKATRATPRRERI